MPRRSVWNALLIAGCASNQPDAETRPSAPESYRTQAARAKHTAEIARRESERWHLQFKNGLATELQWLPFDGASEMARVNSDRWSRLVKLRHAARAPSDTEAQAFWIHYEANLEISEIVVRTRKRMLDLCVQLYAAGTIDRATLDAADRAHHTAQTARHEARMGRYTSQTLTSSKTSNSSSE